MGGSDMLKIVIEDDINMEDSSDIIDCPLYIECEELSFPCKGWIDFAYPILEEWKYNLVKAKNSYEDRFMLYFHEGSYWMEIYKKDTELKINFVMDKHTVKEYVCDYYDLINELYTAYKTFAKILYKNEKYQSRISGAYRQTMQSIKELK